MGIRLGRGPARLPRAKGTRPSLCPRVAGPGRGCPGEGVREWLSRRLVLEAAENRLRAAEEMTERIEAIELVRIRLPLVRPFTTSFGTSVDKDCLLVRAIGEDGAEGWGECAAMEKPVYSYEWTGGAWTALREFLIPAAPAGRPNGI